jgi:serine/threonine protein kinase
LSPEVYVKSDNTIPLNLRRSAGPPATRPGQATLRNERMPRLRGNRYELVRRLGSGGMADVYLACDVVLERDVAIKVLRSALRDRSMVDRFHREAVSLATLRSEHVVSVLDAEVNLDSVYLVMEYIRGKSLAELLDDGGPMSPARAVTIVAQLLDGLDHLHRQGFVHRDVKPANLMIEEGDHAVLVDRGIVCDRRRPGLTPADFVAGTPSYLAPEQQVWKVVDGRADLYQAGLLMLCALTGVEPSELGKPIDRAVLTQVLAPVPAPLAAVVRQALATDVSERYATAADMKRTLLEALKQSETQELRLDDRIEVAATRDPEPPQRSASRRRPPTFFTHERNRRLRRWTGGIAGVALVVAAVLVSRTPLTVQAESLAPAAPATSPVVRSVDPAAVSPVADPAPAPVVRTAAPASAAPRGAVPRKVALPSTRAPRASPSVTSAWSDEPRLARALEHERNGALEQAIAAYRRYLRQSPDGVHAAAVRRHAAALSHAP